MDLEEGLRKLWFWIFNNWFDIVFVMFFFYVSNFIWLEIYVYKFVEIFFYVILSIFVVYIYIYKL